MYQEQFAGKTSVIDLFRVTRIIIISCLVFIFLLVVCDYVFNYLDVLEDLSFRRIWNVARENSIPTWFSSMLAHLLAVTVFAIAAVQRKIIPAWKTAAWVLIGLFFLWIGIDDFAEIHEKLGGVLVRMAQQGENTAATEFLLQNPSFSWHTFIAPVFALCGLFILGFLWMTFWRQHLLHFLIMGFGCWAVAQGLDFLEGLDNIVDLYAWVQDTLSVEDEYAISHSFKAVEETLEMLGTALLWAGFLYYLAHVSDGLEFRLENGKKD
ncbi:MAG: hypothetical protein V2I48_04545 [Xanthomonadales bacterium]|jgi:hypothetical protein|nr:hypothetical protein [Xanthomonadales bacterium]